MDTTIFPLTDFVRWAHLLESHRLEKVDHVPPAGGDHHDGRRHLGLLRICTQTLALILVARGALPVSAFAQAQAASAGPTASLECPGISFTVTTGTSEGDCVIDKGVRALCSDRHSNTSYARCDGGCLASSGMGSCALAGEDAVGGSSVLACPDGARYLLRTGTGKGVCRGETGPDGPSVFCGDGKNHHVEATCSKGCVLPRGSAFCAKYKAEPPPTPAPARP